MRLRALSVIGGLSVAAVMAFGLSQGVAAKTLRWSSHGDFLTMDSRDAAIVDALKIHNAEVAHVPLHHQMIPWGMRSNMTVVHRADNRLELRWVQVN